MEFRPLGASGIDVSALCLGSWLTFEYMDRSDARAVLHRAVDAGIRFVDESDEGLLVPIDAQHHRSFLPRQLDSRRAVWASMYEPIGVEGA